MALTSSFVDQVMVVQLKVESGKLTFDPPFRELRDILLTLLTDIVQNAEDLPRVRLSFMKLTVFPVPALCSDMMYIDL